MGKHSKDIRDTGGGFSVNGPISDRLKKDPKSVERDGDDRSSTGTNDRHGKR